MRWARSRIMFEFFRRWSLSVFEVVDFDWTGCFFFTRRESPDISEANELIYQYVYKYVFFIGNVILVEVCPLSELNKLHNRCLISYERVFQVFVMNTFGFVCLRFTFKWLRCISNSCRKEFTVEHVHVEKTNVWFRFQVEISKEILIQKILPNENSLYYTYVVSD